MTSHVCVLFMEWQVLNPATGEVVAIVPCMGQSETNNAISSAYDAFRCKKLHTEPT
jgi:acyl-CoA reductase-like NAD-dependent aldehyde dehydrogenase